MKVRFLGKGRDTSVCTGPRGFKEESPLPCVEVGPGELWEEGGEPRNVSGGRHGWQVSGALCG